MASLAPVDVVSFAAYFNITYFYLYSASIDSMDFSSPVLDCELSVHLQCSYRC